MKKITQEALNNANIICFDCGGLYGYKQPGVCTVYMSKCSICGLIKECTERRDFGGLAPLLPEETDPVRDFLRQSNAIEGVFDEDSLEESLIAWEHTRGIGVRMTKQYLLKLHAVLMANQPIQEKFVGAYRKIDVRVGTAICPSWRRVPSLMEACLDQMNDTIEYADVIRDHSVEALEARIKQDHVRFEEIHPFADGNGRIGRILLNWQRIRVGLPILVIKEKEKYAYYAWFKRQ